MSADETPEELQARARRAVAAFRKLQPTLNAYVWALTGDKKIRIVTRHDAPDGATSTNGKKIYITPPLSLGDEVRHERTLCDKRDANMQLICKACRQREEVVIVIYHEIAHIIHGTFSPMTKASADLWLKYAYKRMPKAKADKLYADLLVRLRDPKDMQTFFEYENHLNPYFQFLINCLEDYRIDNEMYSARPGTYVMMRALNLSVYRKDRPGDELDERQLNVQMSLAVLAVLDNYDVLEFFDERIQRDIADPGLAAAIQASRGVKTNADTFAAGLVLLDELNRLGYLVVPPEEEPEPGDEGEPSEEDEPAEGDESAPDQAGQDEPESDEDPGEGGGESEDGPDDSDDARDGSSGPDEDASPEASDESVGDEPGDSDEPGAGSGASEDVEGSGSEEADSERGSAEGGVPEATDSAGPGSDSEESDRDDEESLDEASPSGSESGGDSDSEREASTSDPSVGRKDGAGGDDAGAADAPQDEPADADQAGESSGDPDRGSDDSDRGGDEAVPGEADNRGEGDVASSDPAGEAEDQSGAGGPDSVGQRPIDGSPSDVEEGVKEFQPIHAEMHEHDGEQTEQAGEPEAKEGDIVIPGRGMTGEEQEALETALMQMLFFDSPSANVHGVRLHRWNQHALTEDGDDAAEAWNGNRRRGRMAYEGTPVSETILGPALLKTRAVFADNRRAKIQRRLKSGKVDGGALFRTATDDDRVFEKKNVPGKKDYFVAIGMDVSGSNWSGTIVLLREAVMAQAELLNRAGVPFCIYAHSAKEWSNASYHEDRAIGLDIYEVKGIKEPWTDAERERLTELRPDSANLDGHALEFLRKECDKSSAKEKIIMYYSDGQMPAENFEEELDILQREVETCRRKGIHLMGVGLGTDSPSEHGLETVQIDTAEEVGKVVSFLERRLARRL